MLSEIENKLFLGVQLGRFWPEAGLSVLLRIRFFLNVLPGTAWAGRSLCS